eukprot:TRINITY_DN4380_c0_g1_i2.p1 TRINITY_DN4380_c0_g1~~TRINITY_DN4380_c0_g1_i2.p1  ORF type:complete len:628 (+),score=58.27 TRINITY_DN4380_c0_g1_i2:1232-3115(+)
MDYATRMKRARKESAEVMGACIASTLYPSETTKAMLLDEAPLSLDVNSSTVIAVLNTLTWDRAEVLCVNIKQLTSKVVVRSPTGDSVSAQILPPQPYEGYDRLCWRVSVPPFGVVLYRISLVDSETSASASAALTAVSTPRGNFKLTNGNFTAMFDKTCQLQGLQKGDSAPFVITNQIVSYQTFEGGPYVFCIGRRWLQRCGPCLCVIAFLTYTLSSHLFKDAGKHRTYVWALSLLIGAGLSLILLDEILLISPMYKYTIIFTAFLVGCCLLRRFCMHKPWLGGRLFKCCTSCSWVVAWTGPLSLAATTVVCTSALVVIALLCVFPVHIATPLEIKNAAVQQGPLVQSVHVIISSEISQTVTLWNTGGSRPVVEVTSHVEPARNQQIGTRFKTSIANNRVVTVDSMGLPLLTTRPFSYNRLFSGNVFPATSVAALQPSRAPGQSLYVLLSQSTAVASLASGKLDVMLHRRPTTNDDKGLHDDLSDDHSRIDFRSWLSYGNTDAGIQQALLELNHPLFGFRFTGDPRDPLPLPRTFLPSALPKGVHLETVQRLTESGNQFGVRLLHTGGGGIVACDLSAVLGRLRSVQRTSLTFLHPWGEPTTSSVVEVVPNEYAAFVVETQGPHTVY